MGKLRMRSWRQSITRPENLEASKLVPLLLQCLHPCSIVCLGSLFSFPPRPPISSSYSSPHQSSQGDVCKTEARAYHSAAQNSSPSLLSNLLPCLLTTARLSPPTCPPSPGANNPYSLCSTYATALQSLQLTELISASGPLHLQCLLSEVLFPSLHSLFFSSQLKRYISKELFPGYSECKGPP